MRIIIPPIPRPFDGAGLLHSLLHFDCRKRHREAEQQSRVIGKANSVATNEHRTTIGVV